MCLSGGTCYFLAFRACLAAGLGLTSLLQNDAQVLAESRHGPDSPAVFIHAVKPAMQFVTAGGIFPLIRHLAMHPGNKYPLLYRNNVHEQGLHFSLLGSDQWSNLNKKRKVLRARGIIQLSENFLNF